MATLNSTNRNTSGHLDSGEKRFARVIDMIVDMSTNATMGTATDDINLITLPAGATVLAVTLQQVAVGTGSGTLVGRVGATTLTGTLASTAPVGTVTTTIPAALPLTVPLAGAELNVLGATATRLDGKVRVVLTVLEGDATPKQATVVTRDAI